MLIINFSHPLTSQQKADIEKLTSENIEEIFEIPPFTFDPEISFETQFEALVCQIPVDSEILQTRPVLFNLPSLNIIAGMMIAWLHGRTGHFPAILRLKPRKDVMLTVYEVSEIVNLQSIRDKSRNQR
jgi:hypothetical protein